MLVRLLVPSIVLLGGSAIAAPPVSAERAHDITPEDYFTQAYIADIAMAPDGRRVAYVEGRWDEGLDRRNMDLWVVDVESGRRTRLTFDPAGDTAPAWSPDGRWLYFQSGRGDEDAAPRDGSTQVWRVAADGGPPTPVTRVKDGIDVFELSHDGRAVYYTTGNERPDADPWKSLRSEFKELEYGHGVVEVNTLWRLDLESWRAESLVDEERVIVEFAVAPDESRIAMLTTPNAELITNEGWSEVDVWERATNTIARLDDTEWRERAPSPYGWIVEPCWSFDSSALAFRVDFDGYPGEVFMARFRKDGASAVGRLTRPNEVSVEGAMAWRPDRMALCFVAEDRARARLYELGGLGPGEMQRAACLTPGDVVLSGFSFASNGALAIIKSGLTHTPDIFAGASTGRTEDLRRVTNINPQVDSWKLPKIQIVKWTSPDGTEVEGILELPPDYTPGDGPLPTLVTIHGGPTASSKLEFRYWIYGRTLWAARGWAVFDPNYRGSTGYGDEFLTDLIENKNNLDVQDILSGVDALVAQGIADPERLAVGGWSNGGYLTNCVIAATDRFKAASSGAGVFDTAMQWSIEDTPGHVINYSGGLPWERAEKMRDSSPLYSADKISTPTVVHVGEKDPRVPPEHSRSLHRALHYYLDVPCELVIYPGTGHGLSKLSHRKAKLAWDVAWFDRYVLGESAEHEHENE